MVGAPITDENLRFLYAWGQAEGGTAEWNPLNTTMPLNFFMGPDYNDVGVRNYTRATAGVCATALTLIQDNFKAILGALQSGNKTAEQIVELCDAVIKVWGTDPATIKKILAAHPA